MFKSILRTIFFSFVMAAAVFFSPNKVVTETIYTADKNEFCTLGLNFIYCGFDVRILPNFYDMLLPAKGNFLDFSSIIIPAFLVSVSFFLLTNLVSLLTLNYLGLYGVFVLNLCSLVLCTVSVWVVAYLFFFCGFTAKIFTFKWVTLGGGTRVYFTFLLDQISVSFALLTLTIALFAYIFAFSYFRYEPFVERLLLLLNLFVLGMLVLVSAGNFIVLYLGWELIGFTSFLLINF